MPTAVRQYWEESEAGWGQRPDGHSDHLTPEDCTKYIQQYWKDEEKLNPKGTVPDVYSRPVGSPTVVMISKIDEATLLALRKKKVFGIRL